MKLSNVLQDDGLSYMAYTEQITFLLFLKMAHEQSKRKFAKTIIEERIRRIEKSGFLRIGKTIEWQQSDHAEIQPNQL